MIKIGEINTFTVLRRSDLGYMLQNKGDEVLLHYKQVGLHEYRENDIVEAFVQYDSQGRLSATTETPSVTMKKPGWVEVVEIIPSLGVFVSINTFKDILISKDDLPKNTKNWPQIGDKLFIKLALKQNRLNGLVLNKVEIHELNDYVPEIKVGEFLPARICRVTENAINCITEELTYIYVSSKQFRGTYHLGQEVSVMVIGSHDDEIVGSLNKIKEEMVDEDSQAILKYMEKTGSMPYTAKTDAETIEKVFHMSRKAFKRALGDLYKNHKVLCEEDQTTLVK